MSYKKFTVRDVVHNRRMEIRNNSKKFIESEKAKEFKRTKIHHRIT